MLPSFPCPNPTCTHTFTQNDVRGIASLTCPKCGTVFQFRSGASETSTRATAKVPRAAAPLAAPVTATQSPPPVAKSPPAPIPLAVPVKPHAAAPLATPPGPQSNSDVFVPPRTPAPPGQRKGTARPARRGRFLRLVVVYGVLGVLVAGAGYWLNRMLRESGGFGPAHRSLALNYSFALPGGWSQEKEGPRTFPAMLVMRREEPNAWLALHAQDYKDRTPRDDEMLREAVARIHKHFNGLEWEQRDEASLAEHSAQRIVFQGETNNVLMSGECLMTAYNGIGYWFFSWAPSSADLSALQGEWSAIRQGFKLLGERDGWTGNIPKLITAAGKKEKYSLHYAQGLWEPQDVSEADLYLIGTDPNAKKEGAKRAIVSVSIQAKSSDPKAAMESARKALEEAQKKEFPQTEVKDEPDAAKSGLTEGDVKLGSAAARVARLRVKNAEDYEHFVALAVVPHGSYTLVIQCQCAWKERETWEERFGPILQSLQFDKK
jgi:hypothetical protein